MKKKLVHWLAVVSKRVRDAYSPKNWTWRMLMVPKPTMESPYPCILVSIRNGHSKLFFRVRDLDAYKQAFLLSSNEEAKIIQALSEAQAEADKLEGDIRLIFEKRRLPEGVGLARTDTGEIVAEAERIVKGDNQ